ncbi:MAG: leucyl aminopeptidase [Candidatus Wallbacteria bacterium]|nr:leucyl aminopeptidase [Candidatus Wallbacteria bacterium]
MWNGTDFEFAVDSADAAKIKYPAVMLPAFQEDGADDAVARKIAGAAGIDLAGLRKSGEVSGALKEFTILHARDGAPYRHVLVMGCGNAAKFRIDDMRTIVAKAVRTLRKIGVDRMLLATATVPQLSGEEVAEAAIEGALLGLHKFKRYKKKADSIRPFRQLKLVVGTAREVAPAREAAARASAFALATIRARELAFEPANLLGPDEIVAAARKVSDDHGLALKVLGPKELAARGMGGILAVGSGSRRPCYLADLLYRPAKRTGLPRLTLVGKGITFDTGGISIKPSERMHHMKYDMAGAAVVMQTVRAVASLELPVELRAIIATAENMPDGNAYRPSDVIRMYNGSYVEVTNTDAEGRMLLADGLAYACEQDPDMVIDVATLTGACLVALGTSVAGLMGTNPWLVGAIRDVGEHYSERFWELPLYEEYQVHMRSSIADICNSGPRYAGAITAGKFLETFVDGRPWAHLDIAGTAWSDEDSTMYLHKPYLPQRGPTGFGVRTLAGLALKVSRESSGSSKKMRELMRWAGAAPVAAKRKVSSKRG